MDETGQTKSGPLPTSYTGNSQKENEILFLAENYQRQFRYLYPHRTAPTLYLENECKIKKLLCTTLCPIKITKTTELREWNDCAIFLADYVEYTPLNNPIECPKTLFSLDSIFKNRRGNCLEMSMILCTLLLSSDFNAYVVQGYATKEVTKKIETEKADPIFPLPNKFRCYEEFFAQKDQPINAQKKNKYYLDFERARKFWIEGKVFEEPEETKKKNIVKERERDILFGKRVHFWVLLQLSKDGANQPVFLEASTGETILIDDPDYLGIEFVWNDRNFWSNNQKSAGSCKGITFDFEDYNTWEAFLPEYSIQGNKSGTSAKQIRMPETWIRDIEITQKDVENRFPPKGKEVRYKTSKVFKYNPQSLRDGLVFRINHYNNEDLSDLCKSHSFYSERADSLEYRVIDIKGNTVTEMFAQNREDALKAHEYNLSNDTHNFQTMEFYSYLRPDRLSVRKWTEEITIDYFTNRSDFLSSRQVRYRSYSKSEGNQDQLPKEKSEHSKEEVNLGIKEENQKETEDVIDNVNKSQNLPNETEHSNTWTFTPSSFDSFDRILENVDFSKWNFTDFLQSIDPAERYATSESESDDEATRKPHQHEIGSPTDGRKWKSDKKYVAESGETENKENGFVSQGMLDKSGQNSLIKNERVSPDNSAKNDISFPGGKVPSNLQTEHETRGEDPDENGAIIPEKKSNNLSTERKLDDSNLEKKKNLGSSISAEKLDDSIPEENSSYSIPEKNSDDSHDKVSAIQKEDDDEKNSETESELDSEIYDDINFDALSDEELDVDYQMFLLKIWKEYSTLQNLSLFYIDKEHENRRDMNDKKVLTAKKRIIKKRRANVRYLQRKETGKPSVRQYSRKSTELVEQGKNTNALMKHLHLNVKLDMPEIQHLEELHIMDLEQDHIEAAEAEIIKKEGMKLLDKSLKVAAETEALTSGKHILSIKHTYLKDTSSPLENSIQNIWFLFENNAYRIDFHRPEGRSTCRSIIFTKPESGSTEFTFYDYLCRQIIPVYEKRKILRPRLYLYLVSLIKKESLVKRENAIFENDMKQLLAKRAEEMSVVSSFKERSGWKKGAQDLLEAKNM